MLIKNKHEAETPSYDRHTHTHTRTNKKNMSPVKNIFRHFAVEHL